MSKPIRSALDQRIAAGVVKLPIMPAIVAQIMSVVHDAEADVTQLADLVVQDPGLAARTMKMANSAGLGGVRPALSVQDALQRLGLRTVGVIVMGAAVRREVFEAPGHQQQVEAMWRRSTTRATWAKLLGGVFRKPADEAYLCGLLQQIGRPLALRELALTANEVRHRPERNELFQMLDDYQVRLGARVASDWALPSDVLACIQHRGTPTADPENLAAVRTVALAELLTSVTLGQRTAETALKHPIIRACGVDVDLVDRLLLLHGPTVRRESMPV